MSKEKFSSIKQPAPEAKPRRRAKSSAVVDSVSPVKSEEKRSAVSFSDIMAPLVGADFRPRRAKKGESAADKASRLETNKIMKRIGSLVGELEAEFVVPSQPESQAEKGEVQELMAKIKSHLLDIKGIIESYEGAAKIAESLQVMGKTLREFDDLRRLSREFNPVAADAATESMRALVPRYEKILQQLAVQTDNLQVAEDRDILEREIDRSQELLANVKGSDSVEK